jgi:hypothetical protein
MMLDGIEETTTALEIVALWDAVDSIRHWRQETSRGQGVSAILVAI